MSVLLKQPVQFARLCLLWLFIAAGDGDFVLDGLTWPTPHAIAASSLWYDADNEQEPEGTDAYLLGITWDSWAGTAAAVPEGLSVKMTSYVTLQVSCCSEGGVHLHCTAARLNMGDPLCRWVAWFVASRNRMWAVGTVSVSCSCANHCYICSTIIHFTQGQL